MLEDRTHEELDELADANDVDDYPSTGNKADKVAALEAAGVEDTEPENDGEAEAGDRPEPVAANTDDGIVRVSPGTVSPTLAEARDRERERVAELDAARTERDAASREPAPVSDALRAEADRTRERELEGLADPITTPNPREEG